MPLSFLTCIPVRAPRTIPFIRPLVLASPDASGGYDYYWGADYKSDRKEGEAWYYDGKSWTRANLECLTMAFELFV